MVGTLDSQVIEKFKEFQKQTNQYGDLNIEEVLFDKKFLRDLHQVDKVTTQVNTTADKFIEIGDIDRETKKYDIANKIKPNLPLKGKHAPKGTILVSRVRPLLGGYTIIDENDYTFTSGDLNPIVLPDGIDVNYVFKIICSPKFRTYLKHNQNTSGQKPTITKKLYNFDIPIPQKYNEYSSEKIQKIIVEFLIYWKINYTDVYREKVVKQNPIIEKIKKALIPASLKHDKAIVDSFNNFTENKGIILDLENIKFQELPFFNLVTVTNGSEFPAGYVKRGEVQGEIPLISSGVKKDIMGNIKSLIGNNPKELDCHYVFNDTKQKWNEVKHYFGKDYYTLTADGEGGNIIKRSKKNYPNGFYTTNICKTLEFDPSIISEEFFYLSYKYTKYKYNFDFATKANNDNLALVNISLPENNKDFKSLELQKLLVEFWNTIFNNINEQFHKFENVTKLTYKIDKAFLYRTFSKIEWREE